MYRHRVTKQERNTVPGPTGPETTWTDVKSYFAWVGLVALEGRERYQQLGHSTTRYEIKIRGPVDVEMGKHRFLWGDRALLPVEPPGDPSGMGKETVIAAEVVEKDPH